MHCHLGLTLPVKWFVNSINCLTGCYYEMLRQFIKAGETLEHEDGFLIHRCFCNVTQTNQKWTHDLQCNTSVATSQKITIAPTNGWLEHIAYVNLS